MAPKFSLQPVLDYRHSRVETIELELSQLHQMRQRGEAFLGALQTTQARLSGQLVQCQEGEIDLFMVSQLRSNLKLLGQRIVQQQARLLELTVQIKEKQGEVISARQEEEALSKLKSKEVERYEHEQSQQEKRSQDDLYIARAFHATR